MINPIQARIRSAKWMLQNKKLKRYKHKTPDLLQRNSRAKSMTGYIS